MKKRLLAIDGSARGLLMLRGPLLAAAVKAGHEVHACAALDSLTQEIQKGDIFADFRAIGVTLHEIHLNRLGTNLITDARTLAELVGHMLRLRPDVTLCYSMKSILYGTLAALLAGVRERYASVTGLGYLFVGDEGETPLRKKILRAPVGLALRMNRRVFFQNPDDRDLFLRLGFIKDLDQAVIVNGSGVNLERFAEAPLPGGPLTFLMIGRLHVHKGVLEYAEAAKMVKARHPEVRFRFVGPHDDHPSALSKEQVRTIERDDAVELLGGQADVGRFIRDSHVFVLPSYREGTSRSMLEAMATGRPVIATDVPGCREPVADGANGILVPVRDASALAGAMERFVEHPELISGMGRESRRIAEERYDVRKVVASMMGVMGLAPNATSSREG